MSAPVCVSNPARLILTVGFALLSVAIADRALAQAAKKYDVRPIHSMFNANNPDPSAAKKAEKLVKTSDRILRAVLLGQDTMGNTDRVAQQAIGRAITNRDLLQGYLNFYLFPSFTQTDPVSLGKLAQQRVDLLKKFRNTRGSGEGLRAGLVKMIEADVDKIIQGNYHPAVQHNAVLLLGGLNETEGDTIRNPRPPKPLPSALPKLIDLVESDTAHPAVKVAALVGILRHAEIDRQLRDAFNTSLLGANRARISTAMQKLVAGNGLNANVSADAKTWLQRRALDILGTLGDASHATLAVNAIADDKAPLSLRCTAAQTLGMLSLQPASAGLDATDAASKLGVLAVRTCENEISWLDSQVKQDQAKKLLEESAKRSASYGFGGDEGDEGGDDEEEEGGGEGGGDEGDYGDYLGPKKVVERAYRINITQRRLKHLLHCVNRGLDGVSKLQADNKLVADIRAQITEVDAFLDTITDPALEEPYDLEMLNAELQLKTRALRLAIPDAAFPVEQDDSGTPEGVATGPPPVVGE